MIVDEPIAATIPSAASPPLIESEVAIHVRDLGKMYRIYDRPQDRLKQMLWRGRRMYGREFWALRDVSFEVRKGETVGIIGRNGSGKSTLLQIIAGTLAPSTGEVTVNGRVAALLELGSGFNPEFTGRENVFLNGSILGVSRAAMEQRFDEIVAFADIGEFIDQPVKTYSSGMVVRLAFAVQAFVPKEILIVDEALAVGDMFFQAKCMAQMKRLIDQGVTVLFVSHDTGAVKSLCRRALLLDRGVLANDSTADAVAESYYALKVSSEQPVIIPADIQSASAQTSTGVQAFDTAFSPSVEFQKRASFQRIQNGKAYFLNVQLLDQSGREISQADFNQEVTLRMAIQIDEDIPTRLAFGYHIRDANGVDLIYSDSIIDGANIIAPRAGDRYVADMSFRVALRHGTYNIAAGMSIPIALEASLVDRCDWIPLAIQFCVNPRREWVIHGSVHWENVVRVQQC